MRSHRLHLVIGIGSGKKDHQVLYAGADGTRALQVLESAGTKGFAEAHYFKNPLPSRRRAFAVKEDGKGRKGKKEAEDPKPEEPPAALPPAAPEATGLVQHLDIPASALEDTPPS